MTNLSDLQPEILRIEGKAQFAVLPWQQYLDLREMIEDAQDVLLIEQAKTEDAAAESVSLDEALRKFGVNEDARDGD